MSSLSARQISLSLHYDDERPLAPWLRVQRLIRSILEVRRDTKTWPTAKATLKRAIEHQTRTGGWG